MALVRVYSSQSSYGSEPFTVPKGSPKIVEHADARLEVHFGAAPPWIHAAMGRTRIIGEALLNGMFGGDHNALSGLDTRLAEAPRAVLTREKDVWLTAFILRVQVELADSDMRDVRWRWFANPDRMFAINDEMKARIPTLDLAVRSVSSDVPNVFENIAVDDRVIVAREESFDDAFAIPQFRMGEATLTANSSIDRVEVALADPGFDRVLRNALAAPAVAVDPTRRDRFNRALRTDLYADDGGSYGRYELHREIQPALMRASTARPLAVMFVDMNGLKQINDELGHEVGDEAIAAFRAAVRSAHKGTLFRTGGDEFVMFTLGAPEETVALAREVLAEVSVQVVGARPLSASVGVVLATDPTEAPKQLIARADTEMYRAKIASRETMPRRCALAVDGVPVEVLT